MKSMPLVATLLLALAHGLGAAPVPTATDTPMAAPTPLPAGCLTPGYTNTVALASGCYATSNSMTCSATAFGGPTDPGTLLMVRIANTSGALPTSVQYAGQAMRLIRSDPTFDGGVMASYYLLQPAFGVNALAVSYAAAGCGWFVTSSVFFNVDPGAPIGFTGSYSGNASAFSAYVSTGLPDSMITDFLTLGANVGVTGNFFYETGTAACCDFPRGFWRGGSLNPFGSQSFDYTFSAATGYTDQIIEVRGVPCGAYVSVTPTPPPATAANRLKVFPNLLRGTGSSVDILLYSPRGGNGQVRIIRSNGRLLRALWSGPLAAAASRSLAWDGLDDAGAAAGSGVYFVIFIDGDGAKTQKKVIVLR
jgi:hypothetical protein